MIVSCESQIDLHARDIGGAQVGTIHQAHAVQGANSQNQAAIDVADDALVLGGGDAELIVNCSDIDSRVGGLFGESLGVDVSQLLVVDDSRLLVAVGGRDRHGSQWRLRRPGADGSCAAATDDASSEAVQERKWSISDSSGCCARSCRMS